jgi:tRNA-dihydrouridine synthase
MIGRGAIGHPWIFSRRDRSDVGKEERYGMIRAHLSHMVRFYGPERGVLRFRKHLVQYIRGLPHAGELRADLMRCTTVSGVLARLSEVLLPDTSVL